MMFYWFIDLILCDWGWGMVDKGCTIIECLENLIKEQKEGPGKNPDEEGRHI